MTFDTLTIMKIFFSKQNILILATLRNVLEMRVGVELGSGILFSILFASTYALYQNKLTVHKIYDYSSYISIKLKNI